MNQQRTILDLHILQTVPPSNLNRDDQGSPKTAWYGGVQRARVSSQAWKRAARMQFRETATEELLGLRTKRVPEALAGTIRRQDERVTAEDALDLAQATLEALGLKLSAPRAKKGEPEQALEAGYLVFLSAGQLSNLAKIALEALVEGDVAGALKARKKDLKAATKQDASVDVALFGRMIADDSDLNVDAAAQVAHAISVHAVRPESDFFTAVDDLPKAAGDEASDAGAAMLGTIEFNSSTLYRYATVDVDRLRENLGDDAATIIAVKAFVQSFVTSMPTGKQNTFANRTLPDLVVVQLRDTQSVNLVGAFERPVAGDYVSEAAQALTERSALVDSKFGTTPVQAWVLSASPGAVSAEALGESVTLSRLVDAVGESVAARTDG